MAITKRAVAKPDADQSIAGARRTRSLDDPLDIEVTIAGRRRTNSDPGISFAGVPRHPVGI